MLGLALLGALIGASAALVSWERRSRRQRAAGSPEARVQAAWAESLQALALTGVRFRAGETVDELLDRLSRQTPAGAPGIEPATDAQAALSRLGRTVVHTAYTGRPASAAMGQAADDDRDAIVAACHAGLSRRARLGAALDPRPALARLRAERAGPLPAEGSPI